MYRVTIVCKGLSAEEGKKASEDIAQEFREHRDWHKNPECIWDGKKIVLTVENDFDNDGLATLDEFGDCLAAYVKDYFDCTVTIDSVTRI